MAKKGPCGKFRIISDDMHSELVRIYGDSDITVKELAEEWNVNPQSLRKVLAGYMFVKPKRHGRRGRVARNVVEIPRSDS